MPGFAYSASHEEVAKHGYVLTPGRYVGAEDVVDAIKRYATLLGQLDEAFPNEFKLKSLVSEHDRDFRPWSESTGEEENLVSPPVENGEVSDGEETTNRD